MRGEISDLHKRLKTTSVYVTHDQIEAMTLGQKIVVLKDGRVEQSGPPLELYDDPVNTFVAGFLGTPSINLLDAEILVESGVAFAIFDDGSKFALDASYRLENGQKIKFGIRPEHTQLTENMDTAGIKAKIHTVENTGSDMVVFCQAESFKLTSSFKEQRNLRVGQDIVVVPDLEKVRIFDVASGDRIRSQKA